MIKSAETRLEVYFIVTTSLNQMFCVFWPLKNSSKRNFPTASYQLVSGGPAISCRLKKKLQSSDYTRYIEQERSSQYWICWIRRGTISVWDFKLERGPTSEQMSFTVYEPSRYLRVFALIVLPRRRLRQEQDPLHAGVGDTILVTNSSSTWYFPYIG